jgi:tRNA-binding EMAP/Myf-like protein
MKQIFKTFIAASMSFASFSAPAFSWVVADGTVSGLISWESEDFVTFAVGTVRCGVPTENSVHLSQVMLAFATKSSVRVICHDAEVNHPGKEPFRKLHKIFVW